METPIPNKVVADILRYKKSGTILDLGVGWGRNALFLAASGFKVTGVDKSAKAIDLFRQKAFEMKVEVIGEVENIQNYEIAGAYGVIISNSTLHFIDNPGQVIERMKKHTEKDGLNVISVFSKDNPDKGFEHLFKENELKGHYKGWKVLAYSEYLTGLEEHDGFGPHRHYINEIIAQNTAH